jgi:hypothetical protein
MPEKKGHLEQLKYDFPTMKNCQVLLNDKWYRVTPRDFRSWGNKRRIIFYKSNGEEDIVEYNGPVYFWNTNKICKKLQSDKIQFISSMPFIQVVRPHERHLLEE